MNVTQLEMCSLLFDVPHRTLQSWLQNEKLPPNYVKLLILNRLLFLSESTKNSKED